MSPEFLEAFRIRLERARAAIETARSKVEGLDLSGESILFIDQVVTPHLTAIDYSLARGTWPVLSTQHPTVANLQGPTSAYTLNQTLDAAQWLIADFIAEGLRENHAAWNGELIQTARVDRHNLTEEVNRVQASLNKALEASKSHTNVFANCDELACLHVTAALSVIEAMRSDLDDLLKSRVTTERVSKFAEELGGPLIISMASVVLLMTAIVVFPPPIGQ